MNEDSNTNDIMSGMPTQEEENELRMAMGRRMLKNPDIDGEWDKFRQAIGLEAPQVKSRRYVSHIGVFIKACACVAALVAVALLFVKPSTGNDANMEVFTATADMVKQMTITSDGKYPEQVKDATLDFTAGTALPSEQPSRKMTVTTSRGMDYSLTLSDGTKVWLNAESRITFPEHFGTGDREVVLEGEAYFEVAKDASRPFIVRTEHLSTRVLGTSFDIKAYLDGKASVVLVSGKVEVSSDDSAPVIMSPGDLLVKDAEGQPETCHVDTYPYIQWKDGFFYFDNIALIDIMRELGRWYNINVVFENVALMDTRLHFVAEKSQSINEIVSGLNALGFAKFVVGDDSIIVE